MQTKSFLPSIFLITVAVAIATVAMFSTARPSFRNIAVSAPKPAAEINMLDDKGNLFRLSSQRGKLVLLYFGFVNCVDECPLTMAHFKQAFELLGPASQDIRVVMVSTDPVRDTPKAMSDFLGKFDQGFIGIPGTPDQLTRIWNNYGVQVLDGGETHSSYTYVIDRNGNLRLNFSPDSAPEDIVHDLKILLAEK